MKKLMISAIAISALVSGVALAGTITFINPSDTGVTLGNDVIAFSVTGELAQSMKGSTFPLSPSFGNGDAYSYLNEGGADTISIVNKTSNTTTGSVSLANQVASNVPGEGVIFTIHLASKGCSEANAQQLGSNSLTINGNPVVMCVSPKTE